MDRGAYISYGPPSTLAPVMPEFARDRRGQAVR